jgi:hypothetical protein
LVVLKLLDLPALTIVSKTLEDQQAVAPDKIASFTIAVRIIRKTMDMNADKLTF